MTVVVERFQDRGATLVDLLQLLQPLVNGGDGDLVQAARHFLAVASDKRYGGTAGEQLSCLTDLIDLQGEFGGDRA